MQFDLSDLTSNYIFGFLVVFCRVGSMFMTMPGFGDSYVAARLRLLVALLTSLVIAPTISQYLPPFPKQLADLFMIIASEALIGIFLGLVIRIILSSTHIAGSIITNQSSLTSSSIFDPSTASQETAFGTLLYLTLITIIFVTDTHFLFLKGIVNSYEIFKIFELLPTEDTVKLVIEAVTKVFSMGFKLAAPQMVIGMVVTIGSGLLSRAMPSMHVFFVIAPLQILLCLFIIAITLNVIIQYVAEDFYDYIVKIFTVG